MMMITRDSTLKQIYETAVGHDALQKILLQAGLPDNLLSNPLSGKLRLKNIEKLGGGKVPAGLIDTLIHVINSERSVPVTGQGPVRPAWWKEAVFYQIYPSAFADGNGDGTGDLKGILSKLDYLKDLGVDALWLSPIYDSPLDDNGYDIRDYRKILAAYGTMEDFDRLLEEAHARGIRLIMDLVVNHTSDEHAWFKEALSDPSSPYRQYYFFRDGEKESDLPNNWDSFFTGPAWNYYEEQKAFALHLFSKKQMDLNWDTPAVRADVIDMIRFWLAKGVDGFRMDVINYISKEPGLPDGDPSIGKLMNFTGVEHYFYGPRLHEYLREIRREAFDPFGAFSVGETPGVGRKMAQLLTGEERKELDMIFSFDHLESPGKVRYDIYDYDLNYYRDYMIEWMEQYGTNCWMSLFYNNHDNPRMVSKIDSTHRFRRRVEILLAAMQMTLRGTPFIFQGDEMGLTNYDFASMDELKDVEVKGFYKKMLSMGHTPEQAFARVKSGTRDHARMLLPWNEAAEDLPGHLAQEADEKILHAYRYLIRLRKKNRTLIYGEFKTLDRRKNHFTYQREDEDGCFVTECNLSAERIRSHFRPDAYECVFAPFAKEGREGFLTPYEVRIYRKKV